MGISLIDFRRRYVLTSDNQTLQIADLFDSPGKTASAQEQVIAGIAGAPGNWVFFAVRNYSREDLQ